MPGKKSVQLLLDGCTFTAVLDIQSTLVNISRIFDMLACVVVDSFVQWKTDRFVG